MFSRYILVLLDTTKHASNTIIYCYILLQTIICYYETNARKGTHGVSTNGVNNACNF